MIVKGNHPLEELLAAKLFSIETVPPKEQRRMVSRAIKAAIAWHEAYINGPCNTQTQTVSKGGCQDLLDHKLLPGETKCCKCGFDLSNR